MRINYDQADLIFRGLFCLIFIGLGLEHIVSDELIQHLMPTWVIYPRMVSVVCGLWLVYWGTYVLLGWKVRKAAYALGAFLIVVTFLVHLPAMCINPSDLPEQYHWMWQILQRSNLVKNFCLLGVCVHLLHHPVGKYSLQEYLKNKS